MKISFTDGCNKHINQNIIYGDIKENGVIRFFFRCNNQITPEFSGSCLQVVILQYVHDIHEILSTKIIPVVYYIYIIVYPVHECEIVLFVRLFTLM